MAAVAAVGIGTDISDEGYVDSMTTDGSVFVYSGSPYTRYTITDTYTETRGNSDVTTSIDVYTYTGYDYTTISTYDLDDTLPSIASISSTSTTIQASSSGRLIFDVATSTRTEPSSTTSTSPASSDSSSSTTSSSTSLVTSVSSTSPLPADSSSAPNSSLTSSPVSSGGLSPGAKGGISVGVIAIVALLAAAGFFIFRRHRRTQEGAKLASNEDGGNYGVEVRQQTSFDAHRTAGLGTQLHGAN